MARKPKGALTNKELILKSWKTAVWPPALGSKVKLFQPKAARGKTVKVIAVGDEQSKESTRKAPKGKIRIIGTLDGEKWQAAVSQTDVFPAALKLTDLKVMAERSA